MRKFYAIQHRYGASACDERGDHIGVLYTFDSKQARDGFVSMGNPYYGQSGARTVAELRNRRDRKFIRDWSK